MAQELGFADALDRDRLIASWLSNALATVDSFHRWRTEDGTKAGLLQLARPGAV